MTFRVLILFVVTLWRREKITFFWYKVTWKLKWKRNDFCASSVDISSRDKKTKLRHFWKQKSGKIPSIFKSNSKHFISLHVTRKTLMLFLFLISQASIPRSSWISLVRLSMKHFFLFSNATHVNEHLCGDVLFLGKFSLRDGKIMKTKLIKLVFKAAKI